MRHSVLSIARTGALSLLSIGLLAPLGIAAAALSGIAHRWPDILAQFVGQAMVAAVAGLIAAAVLRSRIVGAAAAIVCVVVLIAGWPQWAPAKGRADPASETLTVYSANLHMMNEDIAAIATSVAASDADIVMLVEVGTAPTAALDTILAGYPHRVANDRMDRPGGRAQSVIASRRPLRDLKLRLPVLHVVGAVAETPLGPVTLAAVHFTRPWPYQIEWEQVRQADGLSAWARTVEGPVITAGDFNSVSSARIGKIIQNDGGLIPAPGWPGTWPSRLPAFAGMTIDQVYRSPDLALVDRRLGRDMGSDHRPVITRFRRAAPPAE